MIIITRVMLSAIDNWQTLKGELFMRALILFIGWCILFVLSWPLAVLAMMLFPIVWLLSIPFRLLGITVEAVFALFRALLFLPARLLGMRS